MFSNLFVLSVVSCLAALRLLIPYCIFLASKDWLAIRASTGSESESLADDCPWWSCRCFPSAYASLSDQLPWQFDNERKRKAEQKGHVTRCNISCNLSRNNNCRKCCIVWYGLNVAVFSKSACWHSRGDSGSYRYIMTRESFSKLGWRRQRWQLETNCLRTSNVFATLAVLNLLNFPAFLPKFYCLIIVSSCRWANAVTSQNDVHVLTATKKWSYFKSHARARRPRDRVNVLLLSPVMIFVSSALPSSSPVLWRKLSNVFRVGAVTTVGPSISVILLLIDARIFQQVRYYLECCKSNPTNFYCKKRAGIYMKL